MVITNRIPAGALGVCRPARLPLNMEKKKKRPIQTPPQQKRPFQKFPKAKKDYKKGFACKGKWGGCCGDGAELHRITPELQTGLHLFFLIFQYFFKICNSVILKTV